ncbi:hypothetical protein D9M68_626230 [compost metagenome]
MQPRMRKAPARTALGQLTAHLFLVRVGAEAEAQAGRLEAGQRRRDEGVAVGLEDRVVVAAHGEHRRVAQVRDRIDVAVAGPFGVLVGVGQALNHDDPVVGGQPGDDVRMAHRDQLAAAREDAGDDHAPVQPVELVDDFFLVVDVDEDTQTHGFGSQVGGSIDRAPD